MKLICLKFRSIAGEYNTPFGEVVKNLTKRVIGFYMFHESLY